MADNVLVDNGALTDYTPAADEVSYSGDTALVQLVRPVVVTGSEGSKTVVELFKAEDAGHSSGDYGVQVLAVRNDEAAGFGGNNLDYVPLTSDNNGNQNVVIRRDLVPISVQSGGLTTSASAYGASDQVGNQFTLAGAARASGGGGMIVGVMLISAADTIGPFDVIFFNSSVTLASDNAVFAISDADALKIIGLVNLAGAYDIGNNRIAQAFNLAIPYVCSGGTSLYAALITRAAITGTPFAAATDLQLITYVERN